MKNTKEENIELIAGRIKDEFRKHSGNIEDWALIAAKKIHSQWFDFYTDQIKSMENYISDVDGQVKELRDENEIQGNYNDMLIKELESLQKEVIEFAEWLDKEGYYRLNDGRWSINILGRANEEFTTQELYKIYKPS